LIAKKKQGETWVIHMKDKVQLTYDLLRAKPIHSISDFGCGTGRSIQYLKQYFGNQISYYGCDVSPESVQKAQRIIPDVQCFQNKSTQQFGKYWNDWGYDLAFVACVFHHIPPDERNDWVDALLENLNYNGYIIVFEHNLKNSDKENCDLAG